MARCCFWLVAVSLISVSLARYEDCENAPPVQHASIQIDDDEDTVRAIYSCEPGYELKGASELICDLDTDEWNTDPPTCVQTESSNDVEAEARAERPNKKKPTDVIEEQGVSSELAATLDMSCVQAKVKAPDVRHGFVQKYDRRRKGDRIFLVAFYACNDNFDLEDAEIRALYCSNRKWVGELPTCIALGEYTEEEEEYDEYEAVDENNGEEVEDEDENQVVTSHVAPPPPPPPTHPALTPEEVSNEISPTVEQNVQVVAANSPAEAQTESTPVAAAPATDVNIVVSPTQDPYTPRLLDNNCGPDKGGCEQMCERLLFPGENEPRLKCSCFDGFSLDPYDYASCHDIDECQLENGGCEQICHNVPGSFQCACEQGLQIDTLTGKTCIDINECLLRNGHGPCQDTCHNLWRGYRCSCDGLPGTQLATDNHTCEDAGECAAHNGGCSHICLSAVGRVYCLCPGGFQMSDDDKNCQDINECEMPEVAAQCAGGCENTPGSYRCVPALNTREDALEEEHEEEEKAEDNIEAKSVQESDGGIVRVAESASNCPTGYTAEAEGHCVDIDECAAGTSGCEQCINTAGSYECTCPPGYDLADDEKHCVDINECDIVVENEEDEEVAPHKLCAEGCQNTPGSFVCTCGPNQHLLEDQRSCAADSCQDLNNPQLNKLRCAYQCTDLPSGVYECTCPAGYRLSDDLHNCEVAENGCAKEGGYEQCAPGTCAPNEDNTSFSCICPAGYENTVHGCQDVDECTAGTHECSHYCVNTEGAYRCDCPPGYSFAPGSEHRCEDIDECQSEPNVCGALQCVNTAGAVTCLCADGTEPDPSTGVCADLDRCAQHPCSHKCIVESDGPKCICPSDMILAADGLGCTYRDLCAEHNNGCEQLCKPEEEGACACHSGYQLGPDGKSCVDIDECQMSNGGCHQVCHNQPGGYKCACAPGFEFLDGPLKSFCFDVDECALGLHDCGAGMLCENLNGSYTCICPPGYAFGLEPVQLVQPATLPPLLSLRSFRALLSSFTAFPAPSITPQSPSVIQQSSPMTLSCLDIDECSIANGNCSHFCLNFAGSFQCSCPPGYALSAADNRTCDVVNGCLLANGGCSHACEFVDGKRVQCACPVGFALAADQRNCHDIDECVGANGGCAHHCNNTAGSYACSCQSGYELAANARDCLDVDECANGYGNCTFICVNLLGTYACACEAGFELAEDRRTCIDIDECAQRRHDCSHECVNVDGGYECVCPEGYVLGENKASCMDVDECVASEHGCSYGCRNTQGGYECTCPAGYDLSEDRRSCIPALAASCLPGTGLSEDGASCAPVDECAQNNGGCSHICTPQAGCGCPDGLELSEDGKTCRDVDECAYNNGGCTHHCSNRVGGFDCLCADGSPVAAGQPCASGCAAGFTTNPNDPAACVDVDECATPGICQYSCRNTDGAYECICPPGYRLHNGRNCEDINECLTDNGGCVGGDCINHIGSFQCKCPVGQRLAADRRTCEHRTDLRDQCAPFAGPENGDFHCTKYRHKQKLFYNTKCKVWCNQGYRLEGPAQRFCNASGKWDDFENRCIPVICPRIPLPRNGVIIPASCAAGKTYMGERCRLRCHPGFVPLGKTVAVCTSELQWSYNGTFDCTPAKSQFLPAIPVHGAPSLLPSSSRSFLVRPSISQVRPHFGYGPGVGLQRPYIKCPRNTTVFLASGEATAHIILQKPITNMDFRYIESSPPWTKNLQARLGAGTYVITFRGSDPVSRKRARCQTVINVRAAASPKLNFCTPSFEVTLSSNQAYRSVVWEEPRFEANMGAIKKIYKSRIPGELFGAGEHNVYYEATNEQGITARCEFKIMVKEVTPASAPPMPTIGLNYGNQAPVMSSPLMHPPPSMTGVKLLAGHESFIVCPGQAPVKVTNAQTVNLPAGCILKNVRANPLRQYTQRRLFSTHWTPFTAF